MLSLSRHVIKATTARTTVRFLSTSSPILAKSRSEPTPLSTKLAQEIKYEQSLQTTPEPEFLSTFKQNAVWSIEDKAGNDEVTLVRSYGNESIRLTFSIADLEAEQEEGEAFEETSEEAADHGSGGEGDEKLEGTEEAEEEDGESSSFPVRAAIVITKNGADGALAIDAVAEDGLFTIENISFYKDAKLANDLTSEGDFQRRGLYMGPNFDNLDEGVQTEFETFLEDRGIDSALALFIPDLAEHKEQKEYVDWLQSVKGFLEK